MDKGYTIKIRKSILPGSLKHGHKNYRDNHGIVPEISKTKKFFTVNILLIFLSQSH